MDMKIDNDHMQESSSIMGDMLTRNYRLTTAEILYHLPDHPSLLQSYIWQEFDICPQFPELAKFLNFWENEIEGKLHSVQIASTEIITPAEYSSVSGSFRVH